jgi:hypothetical protein
MRRETLLSVDESSSVAQKNHRATSVTKKLPAPELSKNVLKRIFLLVGRITVDAREKDLTVHMMHGLPVSCKPFFQNSPIIAFSADKSYNRKRFFRHL